MGRLHVCILILSLTLRASRTDFHDLASMLPFVAAIVVKSAGTMLSMDLL